MKHLLLITLLSFGANAGINEKGMKYCESLEKAATITMKARQNGESMRKLIERANGEKVLILLITDAYEKRRFLSDDNKKRAVEDFSNSVYMACYEQLSKESK